MWKDILYAVEVAEVSDLDAFVPAKFKGRPNRYKRFHVAFGDRFFILFCWAWYQSFRHSSIYDLSMHFLSGRRSCVWLGLPITRLLPNPSQLTVRRTWRSAVALSIPSDLDLTLINSSDKTLRATMVDTVPVQLRNEPPTLTVKAAARTEKKRPDIASARRNGEHVAECYVRYQNLYAHGGRGRIETFRISDRAGLSKSGGRQTPLHFSASKPSDRNGKTQLANARNQPRV